VSSSSRSVMSSKMISRPICRRSLETSGGNGNVEHRLVDLGGDRLHATAMALPSPSPFLLPDGGTAEESAGAGRSRKESTNL